MSFYPIFVQLEGKKVVVVGGGNVAHRKVLALLECGASIYLAGRELVTELEQMVEKEEIHFLGREFKDQYLENAFMVIAATDDKDLNHQVSTCAREKGVLVNAVDQPPDCDFIVPSILKRGDLQIAISTSGKSPALARKIRKGLEAHHFNGHVLQIANIAGWAYQRPDVMAIINQAANNRGTHEARCSCNKRGHFL